jgi:hypothetical protein
VAIGWQTYLSILDQRAKRAERERQATISGKVLQEEGGGVVAIAERAKCAA